MKKRLTWIAGTVVLVILLWAFWDEFGFISQAIEELRNAHLAAIFAALVTATASLIAMGWAMQLLMRAGGVEVGLTQTSAITLASNAWSTTLPGGPAFSAVLTFQVQRRWGASAMLCGWFFIVSFAISTMWLALIAVAAVIFLGAEVSLWSLVLVIALVLGVGWGVWWMMRHPDQLKRWVSSVIPRINRRLGRSPDAGVANALKQITQLTSVRFSGQAFAMISLASLINRLLDALTLYFSVWAVTGAAPGMTAEYNQTTLMGVTLAYITAKLAGSAQVTPGGVGTVDAALVAILVATGMTAVGATSAAIIYRLISFALITALGWIIYFTCYARRGWVTS